MASRIRVISRAYHSISPDFLEQLYQQPRKLNILEKIDEWKVRHQLMASKHGSNSLTLAALGGLYSDRLGFAFASAYQAAMAAQLKIPAPQHDILSMCVTEEGGNTSAEIHSSLLKAGDVFQLSGKKTFVTLGAHSTGLVVICRSRNDDSPRERPNFIAVALSSRCPGVKILPLPALNFVPEVPHAIVTLDKVPIQSGTNDPTQLQKHLQNDKSGIILPGCGYKDYLKLFRTVEDTHVLMSFSAYLLGLATLYSWPKAIQEELLTVMCGVHNIGSHTMSAPTTHIALQGAFSLFRKILDETLRSEAATWSKVPPKVYELFKRDRRLLDVAGKTRIMRTERAWKHIDQQN